MDPARIVVVELAAKPDDLFPQAVLAKPVLPHAARRRAAFRGVHRRIHHAGSGVRHDAGLLEQPERKSRDEMDAAKALPATVRERLQRHERALGSRVEPIDETHPPPGLSGHAVVDLHGVARPLAAGVLHPQLHGGRAAREHLAREPALDA